MKTHSLRAEPTLQTEVAASVDAPVEALALLPELFADLKGLGGSPRRMARWLADAGADAHWRVVDLGCGLGAVAIEITRRTGCRVHGIDGHAGFVEVGRARAAAAGVASRCTWSVGDLRVMKSRARRFDAAIMAGVWPMTQAAPFARNLVRPGGVYIIDDAVGLSRSRRASDMPTRAQVRAFILGLGDRLEREYIATLAEMRRSEASMLRRIADRGRELVLREPGLAAVVGQVLKRQREAVASAARESRPGVWLVRRG